MAPNFYELTPPLPMNVPMNVSGYSNAPTDGSGYLDVPTDGSGYLNVPMAGEVVVCRIAQDVNGDDSGDGMSRDELTMSDISGRSGISCGSSNIRSGSEGR
jgi:hypothetical protein